MVDIARDPRWGRIMKAPAKIPISARRWPRAQVRGFQGDESAPRSRPRLRKAFAGYGAADGGRDYDASYISEELLRNVYLPPFQPPNRPAPARS